MSSATLSMSTEASNIFIAGSSIYSLIVPLLIPLFILSIKYLQDPREKSFVSLVMSVLALTLSTATYLLVPLDTMITSSMNNASKGIRHDWVDDQVSSELFYRVMTLYHALFVAAVVAVFVVVPFFVLHFGRMGHEEAVLTLKVSNTFLILTERVCESHRDGLGLDFLLLHYSYSLDYYSPIA